MLMRGSMMARLALLGGICLLTMGSQYSCSSGDGTLDIGDPGNDDGNFSVSLTLRDTNGVQQTNFRFGQSIQFELTVTNDTNDTQRITLPSGQVFDFGVLNQQTSNPRWKWSTNRAFTQATINLDFAPHQSRTYPIVWNGVLDDGTQLMPGIYDARGTLAFSQYGGNWRANDDLASPLDSFTISN